MIHTRQYCDRRPAEGFDPVPQVQKTTGFLPAGDEVESEATHPALELRISVCRRFHAFGVVPARRTHLYDGGGQAGANSSLPPAFCVIGR